MPFNLPRLMFLSGCRTGYSWGEGTLPSMAEQLLQQGETAVLSWGDRVLDTDATDAAARLYESLATGNSVTEALLLAYCSLLKRQQMLTPKQRCDWHLLRLYVSQSLPGALVKQGRRPIPRRSVVPHQFVDPEGKLRVASRDRFVGRRRQLQNCLRTLKSDFDKVGVLLHGMQAFVLLPSAISELFSQATQSGKLTRADRYGLMAAVMSDRLDEEERTAIDRLLYAISWGRVQLSDEVSALA